MQYYALAEFYLFFLSFRPMHLSSCCNLETSPQAKRHELSLHVTSFCFSSFLFVSRHFFLFHIISFCFTPFLYTVFLSPFLIFLFAIIVTAVQCHSDCNVLRFSIVRNVNNITTSLRSPFEETTCNCWKIGHQMASFQQVENLATMWRHFL